MRIAMFSDSYYPYVSGVVRSLDTLTRELAALGHASLILAPNYPAVLPSDPVVRYPSIAAPTSPGFRLAFPHSPRAAMALRQFDPEIIHVHSPFILGRVGANWSHRLRIPLVFTYHTRYSDYAHYFPLNRRLVEMITDFYLRRFCRRCDYVVAPSEGIRKFLSAQGLKVPVDVIPTGVGLELPPQDRGWLRARLGIPSGEKVLLFVGRLGREKNLPFLLESFHRFGGLCPQSRLVIVAGGPEERRLKEETIRLGIAERVIFAGRWPHPDVLKAYHGADVFVFSSLTETQGLVVLEAMSAGLPVVAVRATGIEDVITDGENGFLTPPDPEAFATAVSRMINDPAMRDAMGRCARETAREFSASRQSGRMAELYGRLIEAGRNRNGAGR